MGAFAHCSEWGFLLHVGVKRKNCTLKCLHKICFLNAAGLAAGVYSGLTYGLRESRGVHDWVRCLGGTSKFIYCLLTYDKQFSGHMLLHQLFSIYTKDCKASWAVCSVFVASIFFCSHFWWEIASWFSIRSACARLILIWPPILIEISISTVMARLHHRGFSLEQYNEKLLFSCRCLPPHMLSCQVFCIRQISALFNY
jgi:hypothetical protein